MPKRPYERPGGPSREAWLKAQATAAAAACVKCEPAAAVPSAQPGKIPDCPFRGPQIRQELCKPCQAKTGATVMLKILSCSLVDECVMAQRPKLPLVKSCGLCPIPSWLKNDALPQQ